MDNRGSNTSSNSSLLFKSILQFLFPQVTQSPLLAPLISIPVTRVNTQCANLLLCHSATSGTSTVAAAIDAPSQQLLTPLPPPPQQQQQHEHIAHRPVQEPIGTFDQIDPETLELVRDDPVRDEMSGAVIYSARGALDGTEGSTGRQQRARPYGINRWKVVTDGDDALQEEQQQQRRKSNGILVGNGNRNLDINIHTTTETASEETPATLTSQSDGGIQTGYTLILDKCFIPDNGSERTTRRANTSLFESPLEIYSSSQPKPQTIEELYTKTIPQVRSKLRQEGLRQTGFVRLRHVSDDRFQRLKYHSHHQQHSETGIPKNQFNPYQLSSYHEDPTLDYFTPKSWTEGHPPDAEDDLVRHALDTLTATFDIYTDDNTSSLSRTMAEETVQQRIMEPGRPWLYNVDIHCDIQHPIRLKLEITVISPSSGRTLSQLVRKITLKANRTQHHVTGYLSLDTTSLEVGTYHAYSKLYYLDDSSKTKVLLTTNGPLELTVLY